MKRLIVVVAVLSLVTACAAGNSTMQNAASWDQCERDCADTHFDKPDRVQWHQWDVCYKQCKERFSTAP